MGAAVRAPANATAAQIHGPLGDGRWLCTVHPAEQWCALDPAALIPGDLRPLPDGVWRITYAGQPGRFLLRVENRLELWDMTAPARLAVLADGDFYNAVAQDGSLYLFRREEIVVVDGFLSR